MSIRNLATRADIFFVFDNTLKDTRERLRLRLIGPLPADLLDNIDRLMAAFHPDLMLEHPYPERVLSRYPAKRELFRGPDTLMVDTMNSDAERVARASDDNRSQISRLREKFTVLMTEFSREEGKEEKAKIVAELVVLGHEWCILESRIEAVNQWYQMMWVPPCF